MMRDHVGVTLGSLCHVTCVVFGSKNLDMHTFWVEQLRSARCAHRKTSICTGSKSIDLHGFWIEHPRSACMLGSACCLCRRTSTGAPFRSRHIGLHAGISTLERQYRFFRTCLKNVKQMLTNVPLGAKKQKCIQTTLTKKHQKLIQYIVGSFMSVPNGHARVEL